MISFQQLIKSSLPEDTTSDVLDESLKQAIANNDINTISDIAAHENTSPDSLSNIYSHVKEKLFSQTENEQPITGTSAYSRSAQTGPVVNLMHSVLTHKNFKPSDAEDFLNNAPQKLNNYFYNDSMHQAALRVKGLNDKAIENYVEKTLNDHGNLSPNEDDEHFHQRLKKIDLSPEFYLKLLEKRPKFPETHELYTNEDAHKQKRSHFLYNSVLGNFALSSKHTEQSFNDLVDLALNDKFQDFKTSDGYFDQSKITFFNNLASNGLITTENLNKLHEKFSSYDVGYLRQDVTASILSNPKVDPSLIAKIAKDKSNPHNVTALSSPFLPSETVDSLLSKPRFDYDDDSVIRSLAKNPSLSADQLKKLYKKVSSSTLPGHSQKSLGNRVLKNPNYPADEIHNEWNKTEKTTDDARFFLSLEKLHPETLKDLVNHKNKNVALDALDHKSINEEVIDSAIKRKSRDVSEKASLHPLVAVREIKNGLISGKINPTRIIKDPEVSKNFNSLSNEDKQLTISSINKKFNSEKFTESLNSSTNIAELDASIPDGIKNFLEVKKMLANDPNLDAESQQKNIQDILNVFNKSYNVQTPISSRRMDERLIDVRNTLKDFINKNNKEFENSAINNDKFLYETSYDPEYFKQIKNPSFIKNAWEKIKQNEQAHITIMSDRGIPSSFSTKTASKTFALNPNTPEDLFNEIALNKEFLIHDETSYYQVRDRVFKDRAAALSDPEREKMFNDLSQVDKDMTQAGALCATESEACPPTSWNKIFDQLKIENKLFLFKNDGVDLLKTKADDKSFEDLLDGKYDEEFRSSNPLRLVESFKKNKFNSGDLFYSTDHIYEDNSFKKLALSALDSANNSHIAIFDKFIKKSLSNQNEDYKPLVDIIHHADDTVLQKSQKTIDDLYKNNHMAAAVLDCSNNLDKDFFLKGEEWLDKFLMDLKNKIKKSNPQNSDDEIEQKVNESINAILQTAVLDLNSQKLYAKYAKSLYRNLKGKLYDYNDRNVGYLFDKLTNLPSSYKQEEINEKLVWLDFLTQEKKMDLLAKRSGSLEELVEKMPEGGEKNKVLKSIIFGQPEKITKKLLDSIIPNLSSNFLNLNKQVVYTTRGKSKELSEEDLASYQKGLKTIFDKIHELYPTETKPEAILKLVKNTILDNHESPLRGTPSKAQRKQLLSSFIDQIEEKHGNDKSFTQILFPIYESLKASNLLPRTLIGKIANYASKSKDLDMLVKISMQSKAPASVQKALKNTLSRTENLSLEQLGTVSQLLQSNVDAGFAKNIVETFNKNIQNAPDESRIKLKNQLSENLFFGAKNTSDSSLKKYLISAIANYTQDSDPEVKKINNTSLRNLLFSSNLSPKEQINYFAKLPVSKFDYASASFGFGNGYDLDSSAYDDVSNLFFKSQEVLDSAVSGWKLKVLCKNLNRIDNDQKTTVIDRALREEDSSFEEDMLNSSVTDPESSQEDIRKISRSLINKSGIPTDFWDKLSKADSTGNSVYFFDVVADNVAEKLSAIDKKIIDIDTAESHQSEYATQILDLAECAKKMSYMSRSEKVNPDSTPDYNEKIEIFNNFYKKVDLAIQLRKRIISDIYNGDGKKISNSQILDTLNSHAQLVDSLSDCDVPFNLDTSKHVLSIIDNIKKTEKVSPRHEQDFDNAAGSLLRKWTINSEGLSTEDYANAFKMHPETYLFLHERDIIDNKILNAIDFETMNELEKIADYTFNKVNFFDAIFPKMDLESLRTHAKNFLEIAIKETEVNKRSGKFTNFLEGALKVFPSVFNEDSVKKCMDIIGNDIDKNSFFKSAIEAGVDAENLFDRHIESLFKDLPKLQQPISTSKGRSVVEPLVPVLSSKKVSKKTESLITNLIENNPLVARHCAPSLAKNRYITQNIGQSLASFVINLIDSDDIDFSDNEMIRDLIVNPRIDEKSFRKISDLIGKSSGYSKVFNSNVTFNPAYLNSNFGGKLFREQPTADPEVSNVKLDFLDKTVKTKALDDLDKKIELLKQAMTKIGPDGMSWAEAKKKFPEFERVKEIKNAFMLKQNKPVLPEDFAAEISKLEKNQRNNQFNLTYASWNSYLQRHNPNVAGNLVVQINNSEQTEKELTTDPKMWALYQFILRASNNIKGDSIGLHPTTPQLISWARVDTTSGSDGWIIEELQSDLTQQFRKRIRKMIAATPAGIEIDGYSISPEEVKAYIKKIDKIVEGHHDAAVDAIKSIAKKHNVKKLYMHGPEVRAYLSGGTAAQEYSKKFISPAIKKIYGEDPVKNGFKKCKYSDYPNPFTETLRKTESKFGETSCWVIDLLPKVE